MKRKDYLFRAFSAKPLVLLIIIALMPSLASAQCPDNNHPHMIDLGLPSGTKWACCNVGANSPDQYGDYYAWGETEVKESYTWETYIHAEGEWGTCHDIGTDIAGTDYDIAHVKWQESWQMPNLEQVKELLENCTKVWETIGSVNGYTFTGTNGNTIFVPAASFIYDTSIINESKDGRYWTSTLSTNPNQSYYMSFDAGGTAWENYDNRPLGCTVRPVTSGASVIEFADDAVKALCVANWDTDGDGELSYEEAAAVTDLGDVFKWNEEITSFNELQFFTGLTSIGDDAFYGCTSLTSVTIPNSVTSIGDRAFLRCYGLTSLTIPNSVTSIGNSAFSNCSGLTSVSISNSVTSISNRAFYYCSALTSVTIPNGVTTIGDCTFCGCSGLTSLTIPNSVTSIGDGAFSNCSGLTSVIIGNSVTSISGNCFSYCRGLTAVTIGNSVTSIGEQAFFSCYGLTSVTIPNSVTSIGNYAFCGCSSLTSMTIPNSVTSIGDGAFYSCNGLTSITIPNSVTTIGENAFSDCMNLYSVKSYIEEPFEIANSCFVVYSTATLYVPAGTKAKYETTPCWNLFENIVEMNTTIEFADAAVKALCVANWDTDGDEKLSYEEAFTVTELGDVFKGNDKITSFNELQYFTGLTAIGENAFSGCRHLTSVIIPQGVVFIKKNAFQWCEELTDVVIPNSVTTIGDCAFRFCSSLTSITLPNSIIDLGNRAFAQCTGLAFINIPNSLTTIQSGLFEGCNSLSTIAIPKSVVSIASDAFSGCLGLQSIEVEKGSSYFLSMGGVLFNMGMTGIIRYPSGKPNSSFKIPSSVSYIAAESFSECSNLVNIEIPNSVVSIMDRAFRGCSGLTSLNLPSSIYYIGMWAFSGCSGLTSLIIPNSITSISDGTFYGCSGLTSVTIPNSVTSINYCAFDDCNDLVTVTSCIQEPSAINENAFSVFSTATLYVPAGTKALYEAAKGWNLFENIVEMEVPEGIAINEENFPDENFRNWVLAQEYGFDDVLTDEEIAAITVINVESKNISNLKGIEYFTALTSLECHSNQLTSLDVSKNTALTMLSCSDNQLTSLDVSKNTALTDLACHENQLTELNVSKNTALDYLECSSNQLTSLDVSKNTVLRYLSCVNNQLTTLDVSRNIALYWLYCSFNKLTLLDVTKNTALKYLNCSGNQLTSLDVSKNTVLWYLYCGINQLKGAAMDALIEGLTDSGGYFYAIYPYDSDEQNVVTKAQVAAAKAKGWTTYYYNHGWLEYEGSDPEMEPIDNGESIDFAEDIDEDTNLDGNVVGDIFYNISDEDGSYDPEEGCIVVTTPTDDDTLSELEGKDIFGEDFRDGFTGIVFKVAPGKGTVKVEAQTTGSMVLKVKIGNSDPITMELEGKLKVSFPYNVTEETLVYIYGGDNSTQAKGMRKADDNGELRIYGIEVISNNSPTDIENAKPETTTSDRYYNLNGQQVNKPSKGVYITRGKKVLEK